MEATKEISGMDIHRFLRTFVPGLIFIATFVIFFLLFITDKCIFFYLEYVRVSIAIVGMLIFAYILGVLLEWISQACLHRFFEGFAYSGIPLLRYEILHREIELLWKIFQESNEKEISRPILDIKEKRRLVTKFFDYSYSVNERNKDHRDRIFFKYARMHSVHATIVGMILAYLIGGIWICCNMHIDLLDLIFWKYILLSSLYWNYALLLSILPVILYLFYRIARNNIIAYEEVFLRESNRWEVINEMRRFLDIHANHIGRVLITEHNGR